MIRFSRNLPVLILYLVLLIFYILVTYISEKIFGVLNARVRRGMPVAEQNLT